MDVSLSCGRAGASHSLIEIGCCRFRLLYEWANPAYTRFRLGESRGSGDVARRAPAHRPPVPTLPTSGRGEVRGVVTSKLMCVRHPGRSLLLGCPAQFAGGDITLRRHGLKADALAHHRVDALRDSLVALHQHAEIGCVEHQ